MQLVNNCLIASYGLFSVVYDKDETDFGPVISQQVDEVSQGSATVAFAQASGEADMCYTLVLRSNM